MGYDSPSIFHAKPARNVVDYIQQIGHAGRSGQESCAVLYFNSSDIGMNVQGLAEEMVEYCTTNECLRRTLLKNFGCEPAVELLPCKCCSNCAVNCSCCSCQKPI
jgi:superfamily II DNA helicase RecQ